ncbi:MAG: radical SAM protein [Elusimicrobiales bacterium]
MREIAYRKFSLAAHLRGEAPACQFELTYRCPLKCAHCYCSCFAGEAGMNPAEVRQCLDKLAAAGVLWLCLTGGDPLSRPDFPEIYDYAKSLGFIITIFTSGTLLAPETVKRLAKRPPFALEITVNAAEPELFDRLAGTPGAFRAVDAGIRRALAAGIAVKLKTQLMSENFAARREIKRYAQALGLRYNPSVKLFPGLDGSLSPCRLRLSPEQLACLERGNPGPPRLRRGGGLFRCAAAACNSIHLNPRGEMFLCGFIRKPASSLLKRGVAHCRKILLAAARRLDRLPSPCSVCRMRNECMWCPGMAILETGSPQKPVDYCCRSAEALCAKG